jgi:hypothetical protein
MSEMLRQIANTAVAPELEKIEAVIQQDIPESVRHVCKQLYDSLGFKSKGVQDIQDLTDLRSYLFTVSIFVTLVLDASPDRSSWWAEPFILECYRLCGINDDRDVLIIHSRDTSLDDFSVYPNILETTRILVLDGKLIYKPLDIFVIPAEVKFDISLMALIAHEVGHVYWQINKALIAEKVRGKFNQLPPATDLMEAADRADSPSRVASHIEEYLCDQVGRFLLGPAFDFALLKLFYSLPIKGSSNTHPSQESRITLSRNYLENYALAEDKFYSHLKRMLDSLPKSESHRKLNLDKYEKLSATAAEEIYESCGLRIEDRFSSGRLNQICEMVFLELDGFRPPFETVTQEKPVAINPSDAIVATTIYFHGEAYKESFILIVNN